MPSPKEGLLLTQAIQFIEDYGFAVFFLRKNEKAPHTASLPLTDDGSPSQNVLAEKPYGVEDIERLYEKYGKVDGPLGLASLTGKPSGFVCVDIDVTKNDGADGKRSPEVAERLMQQIIAISGDTRVHKTTSGGYHLLYQYTPFFDSVSRKINAFKGEHKINVGEKTVTLNLDNIDLLANNGYIVLPPTVIDGKGYEVVNTAEMGPFPFEIFPITKVGSENKAIDVEMRMRAGTLPPIDPMSREETQRRDRNNNQAIKAKLTQFVGAGEGMRHDSLTRGAATIMAMLPYEDWNSRGKALITELNKTFNPPYASGANDHKNRQEAQEIRNIFTWACSKEYASRQNKRLQKELGEEKKIEEDFKKHQLEAENLGKELLNPTEFKDEIEKMKEEFAYNDQGIPYCNVDNVHIIMKHHPRYRGSIKYDLFRECIILSNGVEERRYRGPDKDKAVLARIQVDIQRNFFPKVSEGDIKSALELVANDNKYDSYKDYADSLIGKWDGENRAEFWLHKVFNLPDDQYHRGVSAQFLFAMVRRMYEAGAVFDKALMIGGEQGIGKSTAMEIIAGEGRYADFKDKLEGRELNLQVTGMSLLDLAEGEVMFKSSAELLKHLIADKHGKFRDFGGKNIDSHPTRYVVSITINGAASLPDVTSNRRYWVVEPPLARKQVGNLNWLRMHREQIFAELVHKYHLAKEQEVELKKKIESAESEEERLQAMEDLRNHWNFVLSTNETTTFRTSYDLPVVSEEDENIIQEDARAEAPLESEIAAILMSYDGFMVRSPDFVVQSREIYEQIPQEKLRSSGFRGGALSHITNVMKSVYSNMELVRSSSARYFRFKKPNINIDWKRDLLVLKATRDRVRGALTAFAPEVLISLEEKAAWYKQKREGGDYVVVKNVDLQMTKSMGMVDGNGKPLFPEQKSVEEVVEPELLQEVSDEDADW